MFKFASRLIARRAARKVVSKALAAYLDLPYFVQQEIKHSYVPGNTSRGPRTGISRWEAGY